MTDATIGYGSKYEIKDADPATTFTRIAEVFAITPPEATADRIDVTHMDSPQRRREYIAGLIDTGEASFEINWVPGGPTDVMLRGLLESGEIRDHRITFPSGARVTFGGTITGFSRATPVDDKLSATITVAPSGGETWDTES